MKLRDYQIDIKKQIYAAWEAGARNVLAQLATGAGKTVIFSNIIQEFPKSSIAIAHRVELVSQISLTLARYGVYHNIIAQKNTIREIIGIHMMELGKSFYYPQSKVNVAGVDTLVRRDAEQWMLDIGLVVQDEGHHPLRNNKWGKAAAMFPNAVGLYPTATPIRADGKGLGRHADGIIDTLVVGMTMRELINLGYLTEYRIFAPTTNIDLHDVPIASDGDYSQPKLRNAVHKSRIVGDAVSHYLRIAPNKLGITFAVDIESATEIAIEYKNRDVPAEVISSKTPDLLRSQIMKRFRNREILQLVNVDILGEGVDVPAIEVVSFCRPTTSFALYSQQFGRSLRPMPGKEHAIIIDHVENVLRNGLPDAQRTWSLDRRERRSKKSDDIKLKICSNKSCFAVYAASLYKCPMCGYIKEPSRRDAPCYVEGDLMELDPSVLARMRGEIARIDADARIPQGVSFQVAQHIKRAHDTRQAAQEDLRKIISQWAGCQKHNGMDDRDIYREFYRKFGTDVLTAQTLNTASAKELTHIIHGDIEQQFNINYDDL